MEGFCGYVSVFNDVSSCKRFRDLWTDEEEKYPHEIPAIGVTAGVIGSLQANEVIKWICGFGERLAGKLLTIDLCRMEFHLLTI
jgi:adenylyltransferase/sulfurtransferase